MIRLTVHAQSEPKIHLFNKSVITIGSESSQADLVLPEEGLQSIYLNIVEQNNFPIIINLANDPFISLNGHPFGKKLLNNGDVILVHDTEILFEIINTPREEEKAAPTNNLLDIVLPFENEVEALKDHEWHPSAIDKLLSDTEKTPAPKQKPKATVPHLKDDYLKDLDDDNQQKSKNSQPSALKTKRGLLLFFCFLFTIAIVVGITVYYNALVKKAEEEILAAREVADISMALTRAQLLHLKPNNHNWSDSEFLLNNINSILASPALHDHETYAPGKFFHCPYNLRIYTNRDLSRFLLIAQPDPSILQWLIPKSMIVVDSESMELRTIHDLRIINRLLADANPLEGANGKEISRILSEGNLMQLASLSGDDKGIDFAPPKELQKVSPGSENLIYNAPRYCQLGQSIVEKASNLLKSPGSSSELSAFKMEVENFSRLPSYVFYSKEGKKGAWMTQQGLITFAPSGKFLFGYISTDQTGQVTGSYILEPSTENFENMQIAQEDEKIIEPSIHKVIPHTFDVNNPVYLYLSSLASAREKELKIFASNIKSILNIENQGPQENFRSRLDEAVNKYSEVNQLHNVQIAKTIKELFKQQEEMPLQEFLVYVNASNLQHLIGNHKTADHLEQEWTEHISQADLADSFSSLLMIVEKTLNQYDLDDLLDFDKLQFYQNAFRNKVLEKIQLKLLTNDGISPKRDWTPEEKKSFETLVLHEKYIHPNEREYFINEFHINYDPNENHRFHLQAMDDIIKSLNKPKTPRHL